MKKAWKQIYEGLDRKQMLSALICMGLVFFLAALFLTGLLDIQTPKNQSKETLHCER